MGRTQNLEPGLLGSASSSDNLRYSDQVKLPIWALFSHLKNERAGQDDLESSLTLISSHRGLVITSTILDAFVASKSHFISPGHRSIT